MTDEEREEDVLLFEQYEFEVFMNTAAIYFDPALVFAALHCASMFGLNNRNVGFGRYKAWTPIEIAWDIYNFSEIESGLKRIIHNSFYYHGKHRTVAEMVNQAL